jgi:regulator of cell morphogenesis and NO signaling
MAWRLLMKSNFGGGMEIDLLSKHFENDHERLTGLLKQYQSFKSVDFPRAKENFEAFQFGLRRHMAWEEEVLFPLFERKTGIEAGGATDILREHHRNILSYLRALEKKLLLNDRDTSDEEILLLDLLEVHDRMEEDFLYPAMDQLITDAENDAAISAIRNILEERFNL